MLDIAYQGDRAALARLISIIEKGGGGAHEIGRLVYPRSGNTYTIGITGAPGAGKSTLVDKLVTHIRNAPTRSPQKVAVLAIDPSSPFSGGAILGDRVRMQDHATDDGVFIRSMATRGHLGGLSLAVPQVIRLLDAVGIPLVIVETVGVGQVEIEVAKATDTTVVVLNPGWGDAIQANKAGLLEIAQIFAINKADRPGVQETKRDLEMMLSLSNEISWRPPIVPVVATAAEGIEALWDKIQEHHEYLHTDNKLDKVRKARREEEFHRVISMLLENKIDNLLNSSDSQKLKMAVINGLTDSYEAAEHLIKELFNDRKYDI
ncbi:MAG: methylmalonyl Co-A mutase-associated GTPase MeaB [Actinobacteria bacterium]|nr:methylmalonyl Co-A mutase-associated GTPase MeaB [Actinomycetota bacterium]MCL6104557.1 methylmalonyl Co-A mutase-associated GTPase MeaB [Actinomycetota bacterium]